MKPTINLYVDDLRDCPPGFQIARTVKEAKHYFKTSTIKILSLDHDLGTDQNGILLPSGYDLVKYICETNLRADKIYLHTDNPVGRNNMYHALVGAQERGYIDHDIAIYHYPIVPNKSSMKTPKNT